MKEIIPNDLPGRSEQNTFLNYDIFEIRKGVAPISVRSAYDLSNPYVLDDYRDGGLSNSLVKYWDNKIFNDSGYPSASGAGGDLVPYFYNKGRISRETYESDYPKTLSFNNQGLVPQFNEDTMLSLSSYSRSSYQNAGSTRIKTERSGYYEFTFKTDKQNSIIAYGNSDLFQTLMPQGVTAELNASATILAKEPVVISSDYAYIQEENVTNKTFSINLKMEK